MKKLISVDHLQAGMFLEASVVVEDRDGEETRFLEPLNAVSTGSSAKRARLTGKMHEKISNNGGLLVSSDAGFAFHNEKGLPLCPTNRPDFYED